MRLHDEHQGERVLHQDPRVKSTVSIACLCIQVDVYRSHVMFKTLTSFVYLCSLKALGDFDSFLQKHSPLRFARLLQGQVLCLDCRTS